MTLFSEYRVKRLKKLFDFLNSDETGLISTASLVDSIQTQAWLFNYQDDEKFSKENLEDTIKDLVISSNDMIDFTNFLIIMASIELNLLF